MIPLMLTILCCLACGDESKKKEPQEPQPYSAVDQLAALYQKNLGKAEMMRDPANGWLTADDCDGFLWSVGKYAAAPGVTGVDYAAAESPVGSGRFNRRPTPCWTPQQGDVGARSTWSRDMGLGLAFYAWRKKDGELLNRHIKYGEAHAKVADGFPTWRMGDPGDQLAVIYSPALVGLHYAIRKGLGGAANQWRFIPNVYKSGLKDFKAHLQVLDIMLRGEIAEVTGERQNAPVKPRWQADQSLACTTTLDVSESMFNRLKEHADREPENPLYAYAYGVYSGNLDKAVDLCLRPDMPVGGYVRCKRPETCKMAEWLFACGSVLRRFGKVQ